MLFLLVDVPISASNFTGSNRREVLRSSSAINSRISRMQVDAATVDFIQRLRECRNHCSDFGGPAPPSGSTCSQHVGPLREHLLDAVAGRRATSTVGWQPPGRVG
jgi:hypothetical protein